jgi:salicylate hydroxylase
LDGVCLADTVAACGGDFATAFVAYQNARIVRTGRVVIGARLIGSKIYHPRGVEAMVRNSMFSAKTPDEFYDMLDWLYGGPEEYRQTEAGKRSAA